MITTIALDLDNTLLNSEKEISPENERVLKHLHENGTRVILCTGRPLAAIQHLVKQLELTQPEDYSITFNGGLVQNNLTQEVLAHTTLTKDEVAVLYQDAVDRHYPLDVLGPTSVYSLVELGKSDYESFMSNMLPFSDINFADLPAAETFGKVVSSAEPQLITATRAGLPQNVLDNFHVVPSRAGLLEFLPSGVNKASGLSKLLAYFGENMDNLMTFGDQENDLEMLQAAKIGVAMGNAIPLIKEAANEETLDNNADGVAVYLKKYFKI